MFKQCVKAFMSAGALSVLLTIPALPAWALAPAEVAKLIASDVPSGDRFGYSVSVDGDTAVIGCQYCDDPAFLGGSAYVFTRSGGVWTEQAKLTASDFVAPDKGFGTSVAVSGSTVVVGAVFDHSGPNNPPGSAYVFVEPTGGWAGNLTHSAKLTASDPQANHRFGHSVAVSGATLVVGAWRDSNGGSSSGAAYVFVEPAGGWTGNLSQNAKLTVSNAAVGDQFGFSVAASGATVVVGANGADLGGGAYVFVEPAGGWTGNLNENAKLTPLGGTATGDNFGVSVAASGATVVAGALHNLTAPAGAAYPVGAAYVFVEPAAGWAGNLNEDARLTASDDASPGANYGRWVAVSGSTVVVGADQDDLGLLSTVGPRSGSAYIFVEPALGWGGALNEDAKLTAIDTASEFRYFGGSVAVSGTTVFVGARGEKWTITPEADCPLVPTYDFDTDTVIEVLQCDVVSGVTHVYELDEPPTANAGLDQSIRAGDIVNLDGSASFDDNTIALVYSWSFASLPEASTATLSDPSTATPSFVADLPGTYVVELVVTDEGALSSPADQVEISSDNLAPTALAGDDELVIVDTLVTLDGAGSSDPEDDAITYGWSLIVIPAGSNTVLNGATTATPTLTPDLPGTYEVTLAVSDFLGAGEIDQVAVVATTAAGFAEIVIMNADAIVAELTESQFTKKGNQDKFRKFLSTAITVIDKATDETDPTKAGKEIEKAIEELNTAIERTDGCPLSGSPDDKDNKHDRGKPKIDYITDCSAQNDIYELLQDTVNALTP